MKTIEVAIDDYLHVLARTRPWSLRHEEDLLTAFSDWLYDQPAPRVMLDEIVLEQVQRYVVALGWDDDQQQQLIDALNNLYLWSAKHGWVTINPFAGVVA